MALGNATAVSVATAAWTTVVTVAGDSTKQHIGSALSCDDATIAFKMRVQLNGTTIITEMWVPAGETGVVYDAPTTIPTGQNLTVQAYQSSGSAKNFSGTALGS